jgi:hypothetical protein
VPFGRPSSTLVAPENRRLLGPLAPMGLVVHLLRCSHKRDASGFHPGRMTGQDRAEAAVTSPPGGYRKKTVSTA